MRYALLLITLLLPVLAQAWPQDVPQPLSEADVATYRKLFQAQRSLKIQDVPPLVKKLDNKILLGHVAATRLLHPKTRTPYPQLKNWLKAYQDLPQAAEIYKLANSRRPAGSVHEEPVFRHRPTARYTDWDLTDDPASPVKPSERAEQVRQLAKLQLKKENWAGAYNILANPATSKLIGGDTHTKLAIQLAKKLIARGKFSKAEELLAPRTDVPAKKRRDALWLAGFAAYRAETPEKAYRYFQTLAIKTPPLSHAHARATWWAARMADALGKHKEATTYLSQTASHATAFYGQLARQQLNMAAVEKAEAGEITSTDVKTLIQTPAMQRMLALVQVGEYSLAQQELQTAYQSLPRDMDSTLLALAEQLHLPNMAMILAKNLQNSLNNAGDTEHVYLTGLYPMPTRWAPYNGFTTNPAYIYAIMRQESKFDPTIISSAGARGLMQLMPNTANYMMQQANLHNIPEWLLELPGLNVTLGQKYISYLEDKFNHNPVLLFAAYNAGPGNVNRWQQQKTMATVDPITFIESIPFSETRRYVKNVMTNFWMYQERLGQTPATRVALANRQWPQSLMAQAASTKSGS